MEIETSMNFSLCLWRHIFSNTWIIIKIKICKIIVRLITNFTNRKMAFPWIVLYHLF